jgi:type II secretory pathway component PulC
LLNVNVNNSRELIRALMLGVSILISVLLIAAIVNLAITESSSRLESFKRPKPVKMLAWNWFGATKSSVAVQVLQQSAVLQDLSLNADLLGVIIAGNASSATLKFKGRPEKVFKVGDQLKSGVALVEIQPFRILASENGVTKQLLMKKPDAVMKAEGAPVVTVSQAKTQGFALANMFGAVPVNVAGGQGLKVNNLSADVKMMADIRDGDVVLQVDGLSVQDLMSNPMKLISYSNSNSLPVTVMRNGTEETIYVNAASLSAKLAPAIGLKP